MPNQLIPNLPRADYALHNIAVAGAVADGRVVVAVADIDFDGAVVEGSVDH
jgi:hypothetical protein